MPADDVIKTFKKFDKDGNGVISRSELSAVLKNLKSETWDDEAVERLMSKADKNGDGVLQIEEFVNWLFAAIEVDPSVADAAKLVASCPEDQGRMIGELFAFFDIDCDRHWNFEEADACVQATDGTRLDDFFWKQMLHVAPPQFVIKEKNLLSLEGMCWFYMNPDFKFNIEKDHLTVYTKVKMAQEVFDFFDLDKDGYWNYAESYECSKGTDPSGGADHTEQLFNWLVNEVMPPAERGQGLGRKAVVELYCHPKNAKFEMNVAKDHQLLMAYKGKLANEIFEHFDADKDGYWNFQEAVACQKATGGAEGTEDIFKVMVDTLTPEGEDKSKGLSKDAVLKMYTDPRYECDALKDHKKAFPPIPEK